MNGRRILLAMVVAVLAAGCDEQEHSDPFGATSETVSEERSCLDEAESWLRENEAKRGMSLQDCYTRNARATDAESHKRNIADSCVVSLELALDDYASDIYDQDQAWLDAWVAFSVVEIAKGRISWADMGGYQERAAGCGR